MISLSRLILRTIPWILILILIIYILLTQEKLITRSEGNSIITNDLILEKTKALGKIELTKYYFKEITELKKEGDSYKLLGINIGKLKDSKAVLISTGEAVGCIDLTKINPEDIKQINDTILIQMPTPELCYFKIDLDKSRIYDLQTSYLTETERKELLENLYKEAEKQLREAALNSGIFKETENNALLILKPILKEIAGKNVNLIFPAISENASNNFLK